MKNNILFLFFAVVIALSLDATKIVAKSEFPKDPVEVFMRLIDEKRYSSLPDTFSPDLAQFWKETSISEEIKKIRETLGTNWQPEEISSMNSSTPQGVVKQKSFRLEKSFRSNYSFTFVSREIQDSFKIISINANIPYMGKIPDKALKVSGEFVKQIQTENYQAARKMVLPPNSQRITDQIYKTLRGLLVTKDNKPTELTVSGYRSLINGVWYETIVYAPKNGNFLQHLTVYLSLVNGKYSIVTLEFRNPQKIN